MKITIQESPNFAERSGPYAQLGPRYVIAHYTSMESADHALARMCDPQAGVSAHYLIHMNGDVVQMVGEDKSAQHSGGSVWRGETLMNSASIGIELDNRGHNRGYTPFPQAQIDSFAKLCHGIMQRHAIPAQNVIGHSDIAPQRKADPGEYFPWRALAQQGIGVWPEKLPTLTAMPTILQSQQALADIGYDCPLTGCFDDATAKVVTAFQRHFAPDELGQNLNVATQRQLMAVRPLFREYATTALAPKRAQPIAA